jgi:hypothetical protein
MTIVALGLLLASRLSASASFLDVAISMSVMAAGMALVMAPATESVMGSLPPAKAGVGSAVNDTTREVGGALGVAVLGSITSSAYAHSMTKALAGTTMPTAVAHAVKGSLGAAIQVAGQVGGTPGALLTQAARGAFVDAIGTTLLVAAGIAFLGALTALRFLPARAEDVAATPVPEELVLEAA